MKETRKIPDGDYSRSVKDLKSFSSKVRRLPRLTIELTDRCNNYCQHCYINQSAMDPRVIEKEMTTDFIKRLILQAADLGCFDLRFTGGEPLLREDFLELYQFSRKRGFDIVISTNARLITPDLAVLFKQLPPGQPIDITVYGLSSKTYDKVTGVQGAYKEFQRGIKLLENHGVDFSLRMAVLPDNRSDIPLYEALIKKLFGGRQKPYYIIDFYQRVRHDDPEKSQRIQNLRDNPQELVEFLARSDEYQAELHEFCQKFTGINSDKLFECGFGQSISVDAYGYAQGCLLLRHPDLIFDLHKGTLSEALYSFFPKFFNRLAKNSHFLNRCARCFLRGLCKQCPAQSWIEHGTLDTPVEYQCRIAHAHARKLGLLNEGEKGWEIKDWQNRLHQMK